VPAKVAVPLLLLVIDTPPGRAGVLEKVRVGVGLPVEVIGNVPACPAAKVVAAAF